MRFTDDNIKLIIKSKPFKYGDNVPANSALRQVRRFEFKAYMEKNDIQIKIIDDTIQNASLFLPNKSQVINVQYNLDLSFNVFAEDREEAFQNYDQLHDLFSLVKPTYKYVGNDLVPISNNIFGNLSILFKGLPRLSKKSEEIDLYVNNFGYSVNKDMGYIEAPYNPFRRNDPDRQLLQKTGKAMLVPIAFKVDLGGRVVLTIDETANTIGTRGVIPGVPSTSSTSTTKKSLQQIAVDAGITDPVVFEKLTSIISQFAGDIPEDIPETNIQTAYKKIQSALSGNEYTVQVSGVPRAVINSDGGIITSYNDGGNRKSFSNSQVLEANTKHRELSSTIRQLLGVNQ